jgi:hypothetical protein
MNFYSNILAINVYRRWLIVWKNIIIKNKDLEMKIEGYTIKNK